jgi:DNA-binding response OmpR family regulator
MILLADEQVEERAAAAAALRREGYVVEEAGDGGHAVRQAKKHLPDVVVLDVCLAYVDGIEAIRRIRALGRERRPHVIVRSARADARTRQLAFEAGCDAYLTKAAGFEALEAAVRVYLTKRDGTE